jgi:hypothetical protein
LSGEENNSDQNDDNNISKSTSIKLKGNEWTMEDDMAVIYALEIFNLALVDLKCYFYYDNDLMHVLQYSADESEAPLSFDSSSYSTNHPTFSNNKIWKEVERTEGAIETLKHHDDPNNWEVTNAYGTKMARLAFGNGGRIVAVVNDNNTERVLLHVGNHNSYDTYRKKSHKIIVATFNDSNEKRSQPNLTFFEYMRNSSNIFNVTARFEQE